jgi:hypothetical protein
MATWIAHLRIAEILHSRLGGLDEAYFALGNIAPDSGIPDEKWERFEPPPKVTHFKQHPQQIHELCDAEFYRNYLRGRDPVTDPAGYSFRLGYFFHLVTDNLWTEQIGLPTQRRYAEQFAADRNFIWEVKKDWYGLDHAYVRAHPESLFWRVFLNCAYERDELDFLPPAALRQNLAYIQDYYRKEDAEVAEMLTRPFAYLSPAAMDEFVNGSAARLERIQHALLAAPATLEGRFTALELSM